MGNSDSDEGIFPVPEQLLRRVGDKTPQWVTALFTLFTSIWDNDTVLAHARVHVAVACHRPRVDEITFSSLARQLDLSVNQVRRALEPLIEDGTLLLFDDPEDGRKKSIRIANTTDRWDDALLGEFVRFQIEQIYANLQMLEEYAIHVTNKEHNENEHSPQAYAFLRDVVPGLVQAFEAHLTEAGYLDEKEDPEGS
jgi:DNA-binding MarR family transcriptional regulator